MNLILVQAFPANKRLAEGAIQFFESLGCKIYFVNYPGFTDKKYDKPVKSVDDLVRHIKSAIAELNLNSYILGGLSFGCYLINQLPSTEKCKLYLELEPFLGKEYLMGNKLELKLDRIFCKLVAVLRIGEFVFNTKIFNAYLTSSNGTRYPDFSKILKETINGKAFFDIASIIFSTNRLMTFNNNRHHIIIMNPDNSVLDYNSTIASFKVAITPENFTLLTAPISHSTATFEYYNTVIPEDVRQKFVTIAQNYYFGDQS